jgi:hypothetical protein
MPYLQKMNIQFHPSNFDPPCHVELFVIPLGAWRAPPWAPGPRYKNQATFVSNALTFAEAYQRTGRRRRFGPSSGPPEKAKETNRKWKPPLMLVNG